LKYTDRKFIQEEDDVDAEVELALKQTDSEDEKLLEESEEVEI
jgi:hypothetical protein